LEVFRVLLVQNCYHWGPTRIFIKCFATTNYMGILDKLFCFEDGVYAREVVSHENKLFS